MALSIILDPILGALMPERKFAAVVCWIILENNTMFKLQTNSLDPDQIVL